MTASIEMPRYKCHKEVCALKIKKIIPDSKFAQEEQREGKGTYWIYPQEEGYAPFEVPHSYVTKHEPQEGGYYVQYKDGYSSWSPAEAFEEGYSRIN